VRRVSHGAAHSVKSGFRGEARGDARTPPHVGVA
jgi:hypothetical protein